jgi:hypothetical protein
LITIRIGKSIKITDLFKRIGIPQLSKKITALTGNCSCRYKQKVAGLEAKRPKWTNFSTIQANAATY